MAHLSEKTFIGQSELDLSSIANNAGTKLRSSQISITRDGNKYFTDRAMRLLAWPKISLQDPEQVKDRIAMFFQDCIDYSIKPSVTALALSLGMSRYQVQAIISGSTKGAYLPELTYYYIRQAYIVLDTLWEDYMLNGQVNPVCGIFLGKNNFGYKDVTDFNINAPQNQQATSREEIAARYAQLPDQPSSDEDQ